MNHFINLRLEENSLLKDALLERSFASAARLTQKKRKTTLATAFEWSRLLSELILPLAGEMKHFCQEERKAEAGGAASSRLHDRKELAITPARKYI